MERHHRGVVHEDVDSSPFVQGSLDRCFHVLRIADIALCEDRFALRAADLLRGFVSVLLIEIDNHHLPSLTRKLHASSLTYPRASSSHNAYFVSKTHPAPSPGPTRHPAGRFMSLLSTCNGMGQ